MTSHDKTVLFLASDLMLGSTVSGFSASAGLTFRQFSTVKALQDSEPNFECSLLLIDLGLPNLDVAALVKIVSMPALERAVAYGPHVHTEKLQAARAVGIGSVMSRGQFSAQAGTLIAAFS